MKPLKIAVTGASGFVGRHVLADLAQHPVEVVAVTRNPKRLAGSSSASRIVHLDIAQPSADDYDRLGRPDLLIHLAWDGLPNYKSLHHFETELPRQYCFLKGAIEAGLPALLVTGTCFEYGMQSGPLSEDRDTHPTNPYGLAKDVLRRQLEFLRSSHPYALTWTRLFYMYGEGQPKNSIYPQLNEALARGDQVFNMSGGEQLRDYLPVEEVACLIVTLARKQRDFGILNVCAGQPVSLRKLVEGWLEKRGGCIKLNLGYYPYPDYEPMAFWGDRRRLDTVLEQS